MTKSEAETLPVVNEDVPGMAISNELLSEIDEYGAMGYSEKVEDSLIPILGIIQDNSGEAKKKHERYIEGAEAGDLIIRSLQRVFKGEDGLLFQPCGFQHMWVEWNGEPGEGAPVTQYMFEDRPADVKEVEDPQNPDRTILRMPNGNRLVDTRYHFGHIIDGEDLIPCVIPMAGTNHTVSRQWTALMKQFKVPGRQQRAPSFFRMYRLTTVFTTKGAQSWFKFSVKDMGQISNEFTLRTGFEMLQSVETQEISADVDSEPAGTTSDDIPI